MSAYDSYQGLTQIPFDSHVAHQVDKLTGEYEELNVEETVQTVRGELHDAKFDAAELIERQLGDVDWSHNVEEQLFIILEGLSRDLALVANQLENEIISAQRLVKRADGAMLNDLEGHFEKLGDVRSAVDDVKSNFDHASEGAVRIGERLVTSENERRRIDLAVDLLNHISWFEKANPVLFSDLQSKSTQELREILPSILQRRTFGEISQVISELRKVLFDINAVDVQNAQKHVTFLSEALEERFLTEFETAVMDLMDDAGNSTLIDTCKNLVSWLHNYQGGAALHKRFIQCVVEKSIPKPALSSSETTVNPTSAWSKISSGVKLLGNKIKDGVKDGVNALTNKENEGENNDTNDFGGSESYDAQDSLSELFGTISRICQQQFQLIRDIFPQNIAAKVTRMMIQRIFKDSAFGIQTRVDEVLNPKPPIAQLPLPDYLDALANVREKLSALYLILLDYCSHPGLMGMGSEAVMTRSAASTPFSPPFALVKGKSFAVDAAAAAALTLNPSDAAKNGIIPTAASDAILDEINERLRNENEIKAFLEEQIMGVLSSYMSDYFDKEMAHLRNQYVEGLRRVVDDDKGPSKVSAGSVMQMPRFRAEKMKSIPSLVKTVANNYYVSNVVSVTTDSVMRMENIGRDDKKLSARIKEIYILQLSFLIEGVFYPYIQSCTTMLLRSAVATSKNTVLPPLEYIQALAAVYAGVSLLKKNFNEVFLTSLSSVPNLVVVCQEARRNFLKPLEHAARESMHSWTMCVIMHMERTLTSMHSPTDYNPPKNENRYGGGEPTPACDCVCQSFMKVISTVQGYKNDLVGIDLIETFWRPLGQQFIGTLLVHLRKQKISQDGASTLLADIEEYTNIAHSMETPDTIDMINCLKEIASVYPCPPEGVAKVVVENLRHLDTVIILALVKSRSDFTTRPSISHWTKKLATTYGFSKWDHTFQWEKKKQVSVMSVIETAANTEPLGPTTLRKASVSWTELETLQQQTVGSASQDELEEEGAADEAEDATNPRMPAITGPASFAAAIQERFAALMPQEADGSRRKLFSGMSAPELRFNFGSSDDEGEGGPGVAEKIAAGFEDMGEGIRNAGEKVTSGISKGLGAVKNAITGIGRDKSPSRANDGTADEGGEGLAVPSPKPKMINPFKAAGAVAGAMGGAMARATSPIARAISPLRGGASPDGGGDEKAEREKSKMLSRITGVFQKR